MNYIDTPPSPAVDAILRVLEAADPSLRYRMPKEDPPFDLRALVLAQFDRRPFPEREYNMCRIWSKAAGEDSYLPSRNYVGWGALSRAMSAALGPKGGYLIGADVAPMADALRGSSIAVALGALTLSGLLNNVTIPRETATGASSWVASNTAPGSDAEPTIGSISVTPKINVAIINTSLRLLRSEAGQQYLPRSVLANAGDAIDKAIISGAGGAEPLGILKTPGVTPVSGTSISWSTLSGMRQTSLEAGADEASLVWLASPNVAKILQNREKATGSGFIWSEGQIDGLRAVATRRVPDGALLLVPMNTIAIAGFGPGPSVEVSESSGFNSLQVALRVLSTVDVAVLNPTACVVSTTVS
jgi:HK97 family phage major capsid protein